MGTVIGTDFPFAIDGFQPDGCRLVRKIGISSSSR
jgi:hypothetical protein